MADIKQAAKWMEEGKQVRRKSIPHWILGGECGSVEYLPDGNYEQSELAEFSVDNLLAEDWELA